MKDKSSKFVDYLKGVAAEFHKITWPDFRELKDSTVVVIAFIVILSATTLVYDQLIKQLIMLITPSSAT